MRKPKYEHVINNIKIEFYCNGILQSYLLLASELDYKIHSSESECEMCGSHGSVSVDVHCNNCNQDHEIDLKSW